MSFLAARLAITIQFERSSTQQGAYGAGRFMGSAAVPGLAWLDPWRHALTPLHAPRWLLDTAVPRRSALKNDSTAIRSTARSGRLALSGQIVRGV